MPETARIMLRSEVPPEDRWDLSALFPGDDEWEDGLRKLESMTEKIPEYKKDLDRKSTRLNSSH
jgi:oligoendopeptidase F